MSKVWDDNPIDLDCVLALFLKMKKVSALTNTHFGTSVHNETTQNTLLYGIQNIF